MDGTGDPVQTETDAAWCNEHGISPAVFTMRHIKTSQNRLTASTFDLTSYKQDGPDCHRKTAGFPVRSAYDRDSMIRLSNTVFLWMR